MAAAAADSVGGRAKRPSVARLQPGRRRAHSAVRASAEDIAFDQPSRSSIQAGVEKLANTVGPTGCVVYHDPSTSLPFPFK
jgi:hypothetical protein